MRRDAARVYGSYADSGWYVRRVTLREPIDSEQRHPLLGFVASDRGHAVVGFVIVLCAVLVGLECSSIADALPDGAMKALDAALTLFFVGEIVLRIAAEQRPTDFFRAVRIGPRPPSGRRFALARCDLREDGFWNLFDFAVTVLAVLALFEFEEAHAEFPLAARLLRVFRVLRLFELSPQLRLVERQILAVIPTVFSFAMLLGILLYVFAIFGTHLFGTLAFENSPGFADLEHAYLSLFQVMTLDAWSDMMRVAAADRPVLGPLYFIVFIICTAIVSLNVFIAMLSNKVHDAMIGAPDVGPKPRIATGPGDEVAAIGEELGLIRSQIEALEARIRVSGSRVGAATDCDPAPARTDRSD